MCVCVGVLANERVCVGVCEWGRLYDLCVSRMRLMTMCVCVCAGVGAFVWVGV